MTAQDSDAAPPTYEASSSSTSPISLTLTADSSGKEVLISVKPPRTPSPSALVDDKKGDKKDDDMKKLRSPVDFVLTIDVSGSMQTAAPAPGNGEDTGLCVLDVVKHAAKTIITTMGDDDRIAVVTFSTTAKTALGLTKTTESGRAQAIAVVDSLQIESSTNIWDGLKESMNILTGDLSSSSANKSFVPSSRSRGAITGLANAARSIAAGVAGLSSTSQVSNTETEDSSVSSKRLSSIFLLTDGQPNVKPPRGHIPMLKRYLESHPPEKVNFTINTFGFGYDLDSGLLFDIARVGNGHFGFIPDSGMVGTNFVHAVANTYATYAQGLYVDVEIDNEAITKGAEVPGAFSEIKTSWGVSIPLGTLQFGQSRDVVLKLPSSLAKAPLSITARCIPWNSDREIKVTQAINESYLPAADTPTDAGLLFHDYRLSFVSRVTEIVEIPAEEKDYSYSTLGVKAAPPSSLEKVTSLASSVHASFPDSTPDTPSADALQLAADLEGQVSIAIKEDAQFARWGRHYLLSLSRSHQRQQCGNFKDPGVQGYGRDSPLFQACRDEIDKTFDSLPAPTPAQYVQPSYGSPGSYSALGSVQHSRARMASAPKSKISSMSVYNSRAAPCIAGHCRVELSSGEMVTVDTLRVGSQVKTPSGEAKVSAIVKTVIRGGVLDMCALGDGELVITPWHPVLIAGDDTWRFPSDIDTPRITECNSIYSIMLEENEDSECHAIFIGGIRVVTLGHGICGDEKDVRSHPFLSSHRLVSEELNNLPGDDIKYSRGIRKDPLTGLACGFMAEEQPQVLDLACGLDRYNSELMKQNDGIYNLVEVQ